MYSPQESAELIAQLIKKKSETVDGMLHECGLKPSLVSNMRAGSMPSADKLAKIANYFHTTTDYLLGLTDDPSPYTTLSVPSVLNGVAVAFDRGEFEGLTQSEVDALASIAQTLKDQRKL